MPTRYEPRLTERVFLHASAVRIRAWLSERSDGVLKALRFHEEHGKFGDHSGAYDDQISRFIDELIDEITGILIEALSLSVSMPLGVLLASLSKIERQPALGLSPNLPGPIDRALASHYRRHNEKRGKFWPDAMRIAPPGFKGRFQLPTERRLKRAAILAQKELRLRRLRGRPSVEAHDLLAEKLGSLFLRYQRSITRITEVEEKTAPRSNERGDFLQFVQSVLPGLSILLQERRLTPVTANSVVRAASRMYGARRKSAPKPRTQFLP